MDQELIAYLGQHFRETNGQIQTLREEVKGLDLKLSEEIRLTNVQVEGLRGDIRLVAEAVAGVDQKLETFRVEVREEIEEARTFSRLADMHLDRRVQALEKQVFPGAGAPTL